jgi:signal transduction histidine kinase
MLERDTPDLILSDIMMPFIDGQELCRRAKQRRETANVPFILLTARSKTTMKIEGLDCGAEDYVCKPFEEAELQARVRALLRVRRASILLDQRNAELEKINKELKTTQQQLVQAEKLSSLGQLVAGLAHEINNSINAVYNGVPALKLRLQKLQKMLSAPTGSEPSRLNSEVTTHFEKMAVLYEVIRDGAERTARIVSDMKTFAHPGRERNEDFDLHRALDLCLNLSVKQSMGKIEIIREYGEVPVIHGPYGQLHQVFLNLLTNAAQAMPDGGRITIQTTRKQDWFVVQIRDTGTGIPERIRNKIFEPFFTTKPPGVGTGLGLSISYSIVTKLGGTIDCESKMGVGTEFSLLVPMAAHLIGEGSSEPAFSAR